MLLSQVVYTGLYTLSSIENCENACHFPFAVLLQIPSKDVCCGTTQLNMLGAALRAFLKGERLSAMAGHFQQ